MNKVGKHIFICSSLALSVAGTISTLSLIMTRKLVTIALDREAPKVIGKSREKLTGSANISAITQLQNMVAAKLEQTQCEVVEISAQDGTTLVGHLHRCKHAKRTIIAMHGWRSSWSKDFGMIADFLFENKCNVLFAEQRGQGLSGGNHMSFGLKERYDCLDWISWIGTQAFRDLPIYLAGISMGASTVLMTGGFSLPEQVKGIVADCGFTSPYDIWRHIAENNLNIPYGQLRDYTVTRLCRKRIHLDPKSYSCVDAMHSCQVPVLFIHGTDDCFVPIEMTYENYKACTAPKRLFIVPGAQHGMSYVVDKSGYEATILKFWHDCERNIKKAAP